MRWRVGILVSMSTLAFAGSGCHRLTARDARAYENPPAGPTRTRATPAPETLRDAVATLPVARRQMIEFALDRLGSREPGLDCSRWVQRCYGAAGIEMPRNTRAQLAGGTAISTPQLEPGDLVFFAFRARPVDHVGLYTGNGAFVHVSSSAGCVQLARLDAPEFTAAHVANRRWIGPESTDVRSSAPVSGGVP